jgi:amidophosphoribosyltransferase
MSGIVGVYSTDRKFTGNDLIEWLYGAEHQIEPRGESASGVSIVNQWGQIKTEKNLGPVGVAIPIQRLQKTSDPSVYAAIGHTRYAREEHPSIVNTQPIEVESEHYRAAIAADSMLAGLDENWGEMRSWFEYDNEIQTQTGAEIFGRLLLKELERTRNIEKAGEKFFYNMDGRGIYSILMLLQEKGKGDTNLLAITDAHAGKPLCFAEKDGIFFFASGTYPLEHYGIDIKNINEVNQSSIFNVSENGLDIHEFERDKRMRCVFEHIYFDASFNRALKPLGPKFYELFDKYYKKLEISPKLRENPANYIIRNILGACLAETYPELKNELEILIPIVQTGNGVTYGLSKAYGIPLAPDALCKLAVGRTFQESDPDIRRLRVDLKNAGLLEFILEKIFGGGDDSVVKGGVAGHYSKKRGVVGLFERLGARAFHMLISYSDMPYPCIRGIVPYHRREQMAAEGLEWLPTEEKNKIVGEKLGAGLSIPFKLYYQNRPNTYNIFGPEYCFACMDAKYPLDEKYVADWVKAQKETSEIYANRKWF